MTHELFKKIQIKNLKIELLENEGCNNGNYPKWEGIIAGEKRHGYTCRCRNGCSNTDWLVCVDGQDYVIIEREEREDH